MAGAPDLPALPAPGVNPRANTLSSFQLRVQYPKTLSDAFAANPRGLEAKEVNIELKFEGELIDYRLWMQDTRLFLAQLHWLQHLTFTQDIRLSLPKDMDPDEVEGWIRGANNSHMSVEGHVRLATNLLQVQCRDLRIIEHDITLFVPMWDYFNQQMQHYDEVDRCKFRVKFASQSRREGTGWDMSNPWTFSCANCFPKGPTRRRVRPLSDPDGLVRCLSSECLALEEVWDSDGSDG